MISNSDTADLSRSLLTYLLRAFDYAVEPHKTPELNKNSTWLVTRGETRYLILNSPRTHSAYSENRHQHCNKSRIELLEKRAAEIDAIPAISWFYIDDLTSDYDALININIFTTAQFRTDAENSDVHALGIGTNWFIKHDCQSELDELSNVFQYTLKREI